MVFKIIRVGSIPAILAIKLQLTFQTKTPIKLTRNSSYLHKAKRAQTKYIKHLISPKALQVKFQQVAKARLNSKLRTTFQPNNLLSAVLSSYKTCSASKSTLSNTKNRPSNAVLCAYFTASNLFTKTLFRHTATTSKLYKLASLLLQTSGVADFNRSGDKLTKPFSKVRPAVASVTSSISKFNLSRAWSNNVNVDSAVGSSAIAPIVSYDSHVPIIFFNNVLSSTSLSYSTVLISDANLTFPQNKAHMYFNLTKNSTLRSSNSVILRKLLAARNSSWRLNKKKFIRGRRKPRQTKLIRLRCRKLYKQTTLKNKATSLRQLALNFRRLYNSTENTYHTWVLKPHPTINSTRCVLNHKDQPLSLIKLKLTTRSFVADMLSTHNRLDSNTTSFNTNLLPNSLAILPNTSRFKPALTRDLNFYPNLTPWVTDSIIRMIESCSGKRAVIQHSMNVEHMVELSNKIAYRQWIIRMAYYERTLGHRFFMEEALHIIHLSFKYHDVKLFSSWLKAIITRISFWKTRSIFRFLKYVFNNYYRYMFDELSVKGIKIRLKGKISAAGNSRKRTILFRSGKNSYSSVNIKCLHEFKTITTFTGVMGFQVWLFY